MQLTVYLPLMFEKQHMMEEVHGGLAKIFPKTMKFLVLVIVLHCILIIQKNNLV